MKRIFAVGACLGTLAQLSSMAVAQTIPPGTYAMPDSGYSIVVRPSGDDLSVDEAGKNRIYVKAGPGVYEYTSDITGATYQLRYRDRASVAAAKRGGDGQTILVRAGGPAPDEAASLAAQPAAALNPAEAPTRANPYLAAAEKYQALALSDKKDTQSWAFCSAAALKRGLAPKDEADDYAREAARRLASISVDPSKNPCPDAIPVELWPAPARPGTAEAAPSRGAQDTSTDVVAANAAAVAAAQAQTLKIADEQAAARKAQAEYAASAERYRQQVAELEARNAANARAYEAKMVRYRACVAGDRAACQPQTP